MKKIILASASPRRRELLTLIDMNFEVIPSKGREIMISNIPENVVSALSEQKAYEVWSCLPDRRDLIVIGADTVVSIDGKILGKPKDNEDAYSMLSMLSGREHEVFTGVTLITLERGEEIIKTFYESTKVTFMTLTDEEILDYIASGEPLDKAGAYGIQDGSAKFVTGINGDYYNVVGLPVCRLYRELKSIDANLTNVGF